MATDSDILVPIVLVFMVVSVLAVLIDEGLFKVLLVFDEELFKVVFDEDVWVVVINYNDYLNDYLNDVKTLINVAIVFKCS